jgi:ABC-type dipeptide/oligopeptide/nickel transport system ATPase component
LDSGNLSVGKYSGGMRRRISVALSTMGNPNVILMDEPTTGMDPVSRRHVWALI